MLVTEYKNYETKKYLDAWRFFQVYKRLLLREYCYSWTKDGTLVIHSICIFILHMGFIKSFQTSSSQKKVSPWLASFLLTRKFWRHHLIPVELLRLVPLAGQRTSVTLSLSRTARNTGFIMLTSDDTRGPASSILVACVQNKTHWCRFREGFKEHLPWIS